MRRFFDRVKLKIDFFREVKRFGKKRGLHFRIPKELFNLSEELKQYQWNKITNLGKYISHVSFIFILSELRKWLKLMQKMFYELNDTRCQEIIS